MTRLADRTRRIATSPTMRVTAAVDRLRRDGLAVIDLGAGEPDFRTPDHVNAAARAAIDEGFSKYTPVAGIGELRRAICDRYRLDYGVDYTESQVIVSAGGKQALYNTALTLFGPGDEVVVHAPYWPTLAEQVKLADATPVVVRARSGDDFALTAELFLDALTPKTRGIVLNSPCNPTGALMAEADLAAVAREARARGIWIVVDLCYEKLIYDQAPHNLPRVLADQCPDQAVVCGSASKAYAMTGWRCGWTIAPPAVIAAQAALQSHATSNVSSITQRAALAALTGSQAPVGAMLDEYRRRRDQLCGWLAGEPALRFTVPRGAFYLWVDVTAACPPGGVPDTMEFAAALLDEERVAVTPGEAFDAPGFIRISYAASLEILREGATRLLAFASRRRASASRAVEAHGR
jgi:aspartate aminotransferase